MLLDTGRRNILLLAVCQALFVTSNAVVVTTSALAGQTIAPAEGLATLPIGLQFVAAMATALPASFLMKRIGRQYGFMIGGAFATGAGLLGWLAVMEAHFWLFCLAGVLYGAFMGFAQYYRFAAADAANEAFRSRAISYVLAGGVVAAVAGPELAKATNELFAPTLFAGCYLAIAVLGLVTVGVLALVDIPRPDAAERRSGGRPLPEIARQPAFVVALLAGMTSYGAMVLVMTATPLAMVACAFGFADTAFVIQWHALGMFAPSFVTGRLIDRFGTLAVIAAGAAMILACAAVNLTGVELVQFWGALLLLGVGWNLMFVGATTLLTTTYRPAEKAKVQALNDFAVFSTVAVASLSSGALHSWIGWDAVNAAVVLPLLAALCLTLWLHRRGMRGAMVPAAGD